MKKYLTLLLFFPLIVFAQQQPVQWYFGYNAGLDFSGGNPVPVSGALVQWEGNATACDQAGNLEFYTDGVTVWDATHSVMPNGTGLLGNGSSTHSATVVPMPGNADQYYLFTNSDIYSSTGFRYSIVDMTLNGGLGDVTSTKNILLMDTVTEECVAIPASGGCTWVLTRKFEAAWYAYLVNASGIQPPVISYAGSDCEHSHGEGVGYLKASPQGDKIGYAKYSTLDPYSFFELYDFDNSTGILSNPFSLQLPIAVYGCSFSPDGSRFYGAEWGNHLYQYDLTLGNPTDIANSKTLVGTAGNFNSIGDLQIAPDGKIYAAIDNSAYLAVINDPDVLGTACNFDETGVYLGGAGTGIGLPSTLIFSSCSNNVEAAFAVNDTVLCEKFCIDFSDQSQNNPVAWQWFFEGGNPQVSTDENPANICYVDSGSFDVTLVATGSNGINDTLVMSDFITVLQNPLAPVITQNGNELISSTALTYQWQLNSVDIPGATNQTIFITQSGLYTVIITNENGCNAQSSIDATIVGIDEPADNLFQVFPNPSNGHFTLEMINETGGFVDIRIRNVLGQLLFSSSEMITSSQWSKNISLENCLPGVYFLNVETSDFTAGKKIMVVK